MAMNLKELKDVLSRDGRLACRVVVYKLIKRGPEVYGPVALELLGPIWYSLSPSLIKDMLLDFLDDQIQTQTPDKIHGAA